MGKRVLILVFIFTCVLCSQETLSTREREKVLEAYPLSEAEKYEVREHDTVVKKGGEKIKCSVIRFNEQRVSIRYEGLKIDVSRDEIEKVILVQDLFQVFNNRLASLGKEEFDKKYSLAVEAADHVEKDKRFKDWVSEVLNHCASEGRHVPSLLKLGDLLDARASFRL